MQRLTNGQRLYLDTNVVYSLLRLNGPERYLFVERILRRSARLGYQIQVHELGRKLADERYQREIEQDKHVRHEEGLREELGMQRRGRVKAEEKNERLQKRVNELRKEFGALRGERSTAGDLRQRVNQLEEEARRLEAKHLHRTTVERRLAGSLAALAGLVVGIVPCASGLVGGTLPVAVDACCGVLLLVGAAVLIWGSGALGVCCALIGACTGTAATVIAATPSVQHETQTPVVSQTAAGRPPGGKTPKPHQQSPRRSKRSTRQTRSKH